MIKTNNIFRIITLLCIAFTMFLAECKSAYSFSLKSIFGQKSSTEDKEDGNKTFSLDSAYQDSSARIAGFNELFDNRPEAERFYFCSGFNSAEIEGFSNTVNINQNLANRVSVNFMLMTLVRHVPSIMLQEATMSCLFITQEETHSFKMQQPDNTYYQITDVKI